MVRVLLILALVATAFWVFTIVDCAVQPATRHRGVSKPVWVLIVVLLPVLGGILWLLIGRSHRTGKLIARAPDDDPDCVIETESSDADAGMEMPRYPEYYALFKLKK